MCYDMEYRPGTKTKEVEKKMENTDMDYWPGTKNLIIFLYQTPYDNYHDKGWYQNKLSIPYRQK